MCSVISVADPPHFNVDPDPAFHINADPDRIQLSTIMRIWIGPGFNINADLDRIQLFTSVQIWIGSNFYFNEGPNPDPDPALSK
jgi:hypothetical protein